jgi:hypothetical protein
VAGVLRLGGTVTITSGADEWTCNARPTDFRGKSVDMCFLTDADGNETPLPFATSLGQHWEPWMIYREFHCNALDEGGTMPTRDYPATADVVFRVACPPVEEILSRHAQYFTLGKPLTKMSNVELFPGNGSFYYKGVFVCKPSKPTLYNYNFTSDLRLTEDRTASEYDCRYALSLAMTQATEAPLITQLLRAPESCFEHELNPGYGWQHSTSFMETAKDVAQRSRTLMTKTAKAWISAHVPEARQIAIAELAEGQLKMLATAKKLLQDRLDIEINYPVLLSVDPNPVLSGFVYSGQVYVTPLAFTSAQELFSTLLEEHIHVAEGHKDFTREFQQSLHEKIVKLVFGREDH